MNSLSWFLYAVDVVGDLGSLLWLILVTSGLGLAFTCFVLFATRTDFSPRTDDWTLWNKVLKRFLVVLSITSPLYVLTPSEKTMYLILGSELGEEVVNSEVGQKVYDTVNKKLDEYLLTGEDNG